MDSIVPSPQWDMTLELSPGVRLIEPRPSLLQITDSLVPPETVDHRDVVVELTPGAGGLEAELFTAEVLAMYEAYAAYKGWSSDGDAEHSEIGKEPD